MIGLTRAGQGRTKGRMWPAGRNLPRSGLNLDTLSKWGKATSAGGGAARAEYPLKAAAGCST